MRSYKLPIAPANTNAYAEHNTLFVAGKRLSHHTKSTLIVTAIMLKNQLKGKKQKIN